MELNVCRSNSNHELHLFHEKCEVLQGSNKDLGLTKFVHVPMIEISRSVSNTGKANNIAAYQCIWGPIMLRNLQFPEFDPGIPSSGQELKKTSTWRRCHRPISRRHSASAALRVNDLTYLGVDDSGFAEIQASIWAQMLPTTGSGCSNIAELSTSANRHTSRCEVDEESGKIEQPSVDDVNMGSTIAHAKPMAGKTTPQLRPISNPTRKYGLAKTPRINLHRKHTTIDFRERGLSTSMAKVISERYLQVAKSEFYALMEERLRLKQRLKDTEERAKIATAKVILRGKIVKKYSHRS